MNPKFEMFVKKLNEKQIDKKETFADFEVLSKKVSDKILGGAVKGTSNGVCVNKGCK